MPQGPGGKICIGMFLGALVFPISVVLSNWQQETAAFSILTQQIHTKQTAVSTDGNSPKAALTGDLREIKERGRLRILAENQTSPTGGLISTGRSLIRQYAMEQGLDVEWIEVETPQQLFSSLQQGRGDIVLTASAFLTKARQEQVQLTLPWGVSQQQVISRSDTGRIRNIEDLGTRQVAIKRSSPVWRQLRTLAKVNPTMDLIIIPETLGAKSILQRVASAQYDVTVLDNLLVEALLPKILNLEVALNVTEANTISWAVRSEASELQTSINDFLNKKYLESDIARSYQEDLPVLQQKKLLRLITHQSPVNYYLHHGKLKGFEHDLMKRFAAAHQMRLAVVIADSPEEMQQLLLAGKGDVVAASLPRQSIEENEQLAFTRAYNHAAAVVIGRTGDTPLLDMKGLSGRRVILPAAGPYADELHRIQAQGIDLDIVIADAGESTDSILFRVANGMYDLTVIGGHELKAQFARQINLRAHFALTEPLPLVWSVREADRQLLTALNEFITKEYRKGFYNVLYSKYIENPALVLGDTQLLAGSEKLSPYDDIVHKYAKHFRFDWRLIVAQMYQESRFDPAAISYSGAEGLMQLIPETAELLGIENALDPDTSIWAGIRYMDYLRGKFEDDLLLEDRVWFSLAAYNAGYNRVQRARLLAERTGLDKNKWFDNVETAMLAMAKPYWKEGETTRDCRCGQTVVYVRDIRTLYNNYVRLTAAKTAVNIPDLNQDI